MDRVVIDNAQRLGAYLNVRLGSKCEELEPSISGLLLPSTADVRADVPVGRLVPDPDIGRALFNHLVGAGEERRRQSRRPSAFALMSLIINLNFHATAAAHL
jgi:hypothetical protein